MSCSTAATAAPAAPPPPPPPRPPLPAESPPPRPTRAGHRAPRHCAGRPRAVSPAACPGLRLRSSCPPRPGTRPISLPQARAFCPGSAPARPLRHRSGSGISFVSGASPLPGGLSPMLSLLPGHSLRTWDQPHLPLRAWSVARGSTPSCSRPGA